jgi:UDPglucose--hexose-1-phosphate uridylyltransferase
VATCPFCPGNEEATLAETLRLPADGPWQVRAIHNRYPALVDDVELERSDVCHSTRLTGYGRHEVIVDSPVHGVPPADLPAAHMSTVVLAYRERMRALYAMPHIEHVILFKNQGPQAGSSLEHPHSQVVGTPVVPGQVQVRIKEAIQHYGDFGECVFCATTRQEVADGTRIVAQNDRFVAFVPWAALSPYHLWIRPKRHCACFAEISDEDIPAFASLLREVLQRVSIALAQPSYNFVIRSLTPAESQVRYFHWYLSLIVRTTNPAGFELGTGMYINTVPPDEAAAVLRSVSLPPGDGS